MKNLFTLAYLFLFCNQILFSQEIITNVDTFHLSPSWLNEDLKVKVFANGDSIKFIKSDLINENNPFNSSTASAYTIKKINGEDVYFYNYNAVQDPRKLAPNGLVIPTANDYIVLRQKGTKFISDKKYISNKEYFVFSNVGYYQEQYGEFSDNSQFYWIKSDKIGDDTEAPKIHLIDDKFTLQIYSQQQDYGLPVRCVEDLTVTIKTKTYDYSLLMPLAYQNLTKVIWNMFPYKNDYKNKSQINTSLTLNFNSTGENLSKLNSFSLENIQKLNSIGIENTINQILKNKLFAPKYKGENVMSSKEMNINIIFLNKSGNEISEYYKDKYESKVSAFNKLSSSLINDLYSIKDNNISPIVEFNTKIMNINNQRVDSITKYVITSFNSRYVQNTIYSFVPGLGVLHAEPGRKKIPGIKMIHISIPLGLISLGSYLIYRNAYSKYIKSNDFPINNYSTTNYIHKVFLTTATAYSILGLIDFSITIKIGLSNKKIANRLNNEIQKNFNGVLFLN